MASGHGIRPREYTEHMAAPTSTCINVQEILDNREPSTHGTYRAYTGIRLMSAMALTSSVILEKRNMALLTPSRHGGHQTSGLDS